MWQAFLHQPSLFRTSPKGEGPTPLLPPFPPALKGGGGFQLQYTYCPISPETKGTRK